MAAPVYFHDWATNRRPVLFIALVLLLLTGLIPFGLFALNQNYVISYFGAQPEDVSFSIQITYAAIIAFLPIQFRLLRFFETRNYLLTVIMAGIGISIWSMSVTDMYVFFLVRIFTGFVCCAIGGCSLTLIFSRLKTEQMQAVGSTIFYGSSLSSIVLIALLTSWVGDNMDWKNIYRYLILIEAGALILVLSFFRKKSGMKRYPLYQVDWISFLLSLGSLISLSYCFVYGTKYYWFTDNRIVTASIIVVVGVSLFLWRQSIRRRPYLHLHIFKFRQFIVGVILLGAYFGMKDSINLVYGFAGSVLRWNNKDIALLGTINIAGLVLAMIFCANLMLRRRKDNRLFLLAGFLLLLFYHVWMYHIFSTDLSFADLAIPVFLQGTASGMLFVPLVALSISSLPLYTGFSGITVTAMARLIGILSSVAGFYSLQLFYNQTYKEQFLTHLTDSNSLVNERLTVYTKLFASKGFSPDQAGAAAQGTLYRNMLVQSQLLTNMAVFKVIAIILVVLIILVIAFPFLSKTYLHFNKRLFPVARG